LICHVTAIADARLQPYRHVGDPVWLEQQRLFVAEGRLLVERLGDEPGFVVESVLVTPAALRALAGRLNPGWLVLVADQALLNSITGFNFHRGCLALVERPAPTPLATVLAPARRVVVLEGIGNPDNVGGIFRSGAALGAAAVLLDTATADPLYRKAIRTSMGAVLRLPFARFDSGSDGFGLLRDAGFTLVALSPAGELTLEEFAGTLSSDARLALLAGGEGSGLSPAALAAAHARVRIPVDARSDSLNVVVAVSIALHRLSLACDC
jgi:tRNA G18 (ribose-2'-O)-methylase SpoU